ncbi:hypothetical protein SISSUDRAFT_1067365 [Sistotremastrum suecicum HHB10207 ss-3]|uniref:Ribonuclease H1 N-terminal domain-containing protein n=1 Tax=Sistotremastrum suecicum HHB10207 ss-3 TaxID=1314776 RepID=A0A165X7B2_9AGAM|nr:hypothetical protein SISSUDRAFT_1067365 [Sistotremastrum suecicum HHB10207 ss-3]
MAAWSQPSGKAIIPPSVSGNQDGYATDSGSDLEKIEDRLDELTAMIRDIRSRRESSRANQVPSVAPTLLDHRASQPSRAGTAFEGSSTSEIRALTNSPRHLATHEFEHPPPYTEPATPWASTSTLRPISPSPARNRGGRTHPPTISPGILTHYYPGRRINDVKKPRSWYVVFRGREIGIFDDWGVVHAAINNYSNGSQYSVPDEAAAVERWNAHIAQTEADAVGNLAAGLGQNLRL